MGAFGVDIFFGLSGLLISAGTHRVEFSYRPLSIVVGLALLVVTTAVYFLGRDRIRTHASNLSSITGSG